MSTQLGTARVTQDSSLAPPDLRPYLLGFALDRDKLAELPLPTERLAAAELMWWLDQPVWAADRIPFSLRPREVMRASREHPEHLRRISSADLHRPIYVTRINDRWSILEGTARLAKAVAFGLPTVLVRRVPAAAFDRLRVG